MCSLRGKSSTLFVSGDELDILNTATLELLVSKCWLDTLHWMTCLGYVDGGDDGSLLEVPETESIGLLDTESRHRLENSDGHDKVRCEHDVVLKVNAQAVRAELLSEDVELPRCQ